MYKELNIIKMSDRQNYEKEYELRFNSPATHVTPLKINPFQRGLRMSEEYKLFVVMTIELINKLDAIRNNSQKISNLISKAPANPLKFFMARKVILDEIMSNNEIEGVHTTRSEIIQIANLKKEETDKIRNKIKQHGNMYRFLYSQEDEEPVKYESPHDVRRLYDLMISEDVEKGNELDGEIFRLGSVQIGDDDKVVSRGIQPETEIINEINNMLNYLNHDSMNPIIKILLSHYFFEYVHPFYDGNGRAGRYIICNYLLHELDILSAFSFSTAINRQKKGYYDAFLTVSNPNNRGEATHFVSFLLSVLINAQETIITETINRLEVLGGLKNKIDVRNGLTDLEKKIIYIIAQSWVFSAPEDRVTTQEISNHVGKSFATVRKWSDKAVELGILTRYKKSPSIYTLSEEFIESEI